MEDLMLRVIAAGFAVGGWVYGHKKGYSLRSKSFLGLFAVLFFILVAGVFQALVLPESLP